MLTEFGSPWLHLPSCGSTNDEARQLGRSGKPHGMVVTSDSQTSGRGRQGRTWFSPPGDSLYLSLLLRPELLPRQIPLAKLLMTFVLDNDPYAASPLEKIGEISPRGECAEPVAACIVQRHRAA